MVTKSQLEQLAQIIQQIIKENSTAAIIDLAVLLGLGHTILGNFSKNMDSIKVNLKNFQS